MIGIYLTIKIEIMDDRVENVYKIIINSVLGFSLFLKF